MARLRAARKVTYHNTIRIDATDPANFQMLEVLRTCQWGKVNQTITEALRIGVAQLASARSAKATGDRAPSGTQPADGSEACDEGADTAAVTGHPPAGQPVTSPYLPAEANPWNGRLESDLKPKPPSTHQKVVGDDPTRARVKAIQMINKLTGKR